MVSAATCRIDRRKQKTAAPFWSRSPGTSSAVPLYPVGARDVRPHPPYGGAASAYTSTRKCRCNSRFRHGDGRHRRPSSAARNRNLCPRRGGARRRGAGRRGAGRRGAGRRSPPGRRRLLACPRSPPRSVPSSPSDVTTRSSAGCATSRRPACRTATSTSGSTGRVSTTRTAWPRSPRARSPGSARSSRESTWPARSSSPATRRSSLARPCSPMATTSAWPDTVGSVSSRGCRAATSCRSPWACPRGTRWRSGRPGSPPRCP